MQTKAAIFCPKNQTFSTAKLLIFSQNQLNFTYFKNKFLLFCEDIHFFRDKMDLQHGVTSKGGNEDGMLGKVASGEGLFLHNLNPIRSYAIQTAVPSMMCGFQSDAAGQAASSRRKLWEVSH